MAPFGLVGGAGVEDWPFQMLAIGAAPAGAAGSALRGRVRDGVGGRVHDQERALGLAEGERLREHAGVGDAGERHEVEH